MTNSATDKHTEERDTRGARYDHMWLGEVVSVDDPLNLGRVQVFVDGIYEPSSDWAWPVGFMHGVKEGIWFVPKVGSNVILFMNQGDVDYPYYMTGPFGAPGGETDVPDQVPNGSVDHVVLRFRRFHMIINGKPGEEKLTVKDEVSGTTLEIDRINGPGNFLRDVEGNENVEVKLDRNVTVEEGNETHTVALGSRVTEITVGNETESIGGNKTKSIGGDEVDGITGSKAETVSGVGGSTEAIPNGPKTITAGLAISVTAGGVLALVGQGLTLNSGTGITNSTSGGLKTETLLGGMIENITGVKTINAAGLYAVIGALVQLGITANLKKLAHEGFFTAAYNNHVHTGVMAGGGDTGPPKAKVVAGATGSDIELNDVTTQNVTAS